MVPAEFWIRHGLVPLRSSGDELVVASATAHVDPVVLLQVRE